MAEPLDYLELYKAWRELDSGASAQIRRVGSPEELLDIPGFYRLVQPFGWQQKENRNQLMRMVFCLSAGKDAIHHTGEPVTLGKALAKGGNINERRIFQLVRSDSPNDMIQLRRLLIHAEPTLNWPRLAELLRNWGKFSKRQLLEDFVLSTPKKA